MINPHFLNIHKQVRILKKDIPYEFIRILRKSDPLAVYICSPWITEFSDNYMNIINVFKTKKCIIRIFTRPTMKEDVVKTLQKLKELYKAQIFVSNKLHAKIYIIEGKKDKHVIIGSANFTEEARGNIELALLISDNDLIMKRVIYSILSYLRPVCVRW